MLFAWAPLVAACSDSGGDSTGAQRGPGAVSGEFAGTIRLGAALSETGKYSVEGKDSRQGYDTWLTWVNETYGGIRVGDERYRAEIVYYDDESDADTAGNLTQRLIDDDRVDFLLGPYSSGLTTGTSAIAEANNVLMVEGNGTSDTMFERGFQNLFLVATIASDYTRSGIEALAARGASTAVIAHEDTSFATAVADGAARHLEANGIEVMAVETYPKDIQDVSAIMTKFRDLDPDLFVGGGHYNDAVLFVNSAKELGFEPGGMLITVWHPFASGRLARWREVEALIDYMLAKGGVWFATMEQIAAHVRRCVDDGSYVPRVDRLPYHTGPLTLPDHR